MAESEDLLNIEQAARFLNVRETSLRRCVNEVESVRAAQGPSLEVVGGGGAEYQIKREKESLG
jgi:hypothetical protein